MLVFDHSSIKLGAQDVFWEPDGAYTGAISVSMLKELECAYCIVGHSERRAYFGETDETVNKKIKALLAQGIAPIMCCGESLDVRDAGDTLAFIGEQVRLGWAGVGEEDIARSVIAYEPVWAIGTGRAARRPSRHRRHVRTSAPSSPTSRARMRQAACASSRGGR